MVADASVVRSRRTTAERAVEVLGDLAVLPALRCDHAPLPPRMWELRED